MVPRMLTSVKGFTQDLNLKVPALLGDPQCTWVLPTLGMRKNPLLTKYTEIVYLFQQLCHSEFSFGAGLKFLQKIAK